jgi:hypothetical protein
MMKAGDISLKIPKGDAISNKIMARVPKIEEETIQLLENTCSTISLSIDGWTSSNDIPFLGVNGKWAGPDFKIHKICIDFVELNDAHSGENFAEVIFQSLKRYNLLKKLISITGDNASNNDTLCRHLYAKLSRVYDNHLDTHGFRGEAMRFEPEKGQIRCLAHILNLICKAILKTLGSSTHKDAVNFLDRVDGKWSNLTLPMAAGDVATLRIIILWISRSPQRLQEWDKYAKKRIPYDVDTRWNYTLRMIERANAAWASTRLRK